MVALRLLAVLTMLLTALAGCAEGDDGDGAGGSSSSSTRAAEDACPQVDDASMVPGWTAHGGEWGTVLAMEDHIDSVCGKATAALAYLISPAGSFTTVRANVSFNMLQDEVGGGSGAGLVINWADEDNYVIVRYSPREQGWHLFTMTAGEREKRDEASVTPPTTNPDYHEWVHLSVRHEAGHVTAFDGTTKVIDYMLPAGSSLSGQVGYFLRDDGMAALFDDFSATAI